ncbi:ATP-binding protein [Actinomadura rudentiformis]|uniref:Helix-turn-helix transcriptional regulator n=1 Tax=Actinomadura rudentiformis TaxID=359158 RepID=A0A6H9YZZ8_9ACTN|nr:winged helix-turn-helix domain-containing protein [Actinomadura rudentiformis]KAB2347766.1 helix-turn-helix transcriptional regulator [Actinomadura rudentiformis]
MRFSFEGFLLDETTFELLRNGRPVPLEPQVFDVLVYLVRHRDRVVPKEELLDQVWGDRFVSESALTTRIKHVRRALGDDGRSQRFVRTVHGRGYRFTAAVTPAEAAEAAAAVTLAEDPVGDGGRPHVEDVPASRSVPHNLPAERTPLFGRAERIAALSALVARWRLVSLLGIGGAGKTRLACATGRLALDHFPDGVWFVDLVPASDEHTVETTIARAAGLALGAGDPRRQLARLVANRAALFVLDNCEHVRDEVAATVDHLLEHTARPHFLVTSREPLNVLDERRVHVEPLDSGAVSAPAVELFRSAAERFGAALHDRDLPVAQRICRDLDGLPLAIELAAAQLRVLHPAEVAERLDQRFELLQTRRPPGHDRHASLTSVLEGTWAMLDGGERELLGQLAAFPGPFDLIDVEQLCPELPAGVAARTLTQLIDRSLVVAASSDGGRLRLLETVRLFARRETDSHRHSARHAQWCLDRIGRSLHVHLFDFEVAEWCARHYDDVRAGVRHLLDDDRREEAALLLCGTGLVMHCDSGARAADVLPVIDELLERIDDPALTARLHLTGVFAGMATRAPELIAAHGAAAVRAARSCGDPSLLAVALVHHSWSVVFTDPGRAVEMTEEAGALAAQAEDVPAQNLAASYRAFHLAWMRRFDEAIEQAGAVIGDTPYRGGPRQEVFVAITGLVACQVVHRPALCAPWFDLLLSLPSRDEPMWANQVLGAAVLASCGDRAGAAALTDAVHTRLSQAGQDSLPDLLVPAAVLAHRVGDDERAARWVRAVRDSPRSTQSFQVTCAYRRIREVVGVSAEPPLATRTLEEIGAEARAWMRSAATD